MPRTIPRTVRLSNGVELPRVGLGVYQARGDDTVHAVLDALKHGYRHIDTAAAYGNEREVGLAVRSSDVPRSEIFVTTKLWNDDQGYERALRAFDASLERLGLDYVDLYLLHWPVFGERVDSWRALERLLAEGRVRAIGVSNFMPRHLDELLDKTEVVPHVNQIEVNPFLQQREVRAYCDSKGIAVEAYSPLTKGERLGHPVLGRIAEALGRSPAQVLLRWGLEHGLVVLPKSTRTKRIRENGALFDFELTSEQMALLDDLEEGLVTGWDPRRAP